MEGDESGSSSDITAIGSAKFENGDPDNKAPTVYRSRWGVLSAVCVLNVAINTLQYSYSPIATDAADYFGKEPSDINNLTSVALIFSFVVSLASTWLIETLGLR